MLRMFSPRTFLRLFFRGLAIDWLSPLDIRENAVCRANDKMEQNQIFIH